MFTVVNRPVDLCSPDPSWSSDTLPQRPGREIVVETVTVASATMAMTTPIAGGAGERHRHRLCRGGGGVPERNVVDRGVAGHCNGIGVDGAVVGDRVLREEKDR